MILKYLVQKRKQKPNKSAINLFFSEYKAPGFVLQAVGATLSSIKHSIWKLGINEGGSMLSR